MRYRVTISAKEKGGGVRYEHVHFDRDTLAAAVHVYDMAVTMYGLTEREHEPRPTLAYAADFRGNAEARLSLDWTDEEPGDERTAAIRTKLQGRAAF